MKELYEKLWHFDNRFERCNYFVHRTIYIPFIIKFMNDMYKIAHNALVKHNAKKKYIHGSWGSKKSSQMGAFFFGFKGMS